MDCICTLDDLKTNTCPRMQDCEWCKFTGGDCDPDIRYEGETPSPFEPAFGKAGEV